MAPAQMNDTEILSTFQEFPSPAMGQTQHRRPAFNACEVGVALRAMLFVESVMAVGALYVARNFWEWLSALALLSGSAVPATVLWLLVTCLGQRWLARLSVALQYACGVVLGVIAGGYGCGMLVLVGLLQPAPWLAACASGGLIAAVLIAGMTLRARGKLPADTAARLSELQSRIRPHFLFNTLNSAIALVRAEPAKAEAVLEDLSDLFRHALMDQAESTTLAGEIELARRYLEIEQVRFGDRLQLAWSLDPQANQALLPPLLLQPLLENAVRHGVEPSPSGARISVQTQKRGSTVVIKIRNSMPAGPGPSGHGVALRNVGDRLRLLHDVQCSFSAAPAGEEFQVRIEVPA